MTVTESSKLEAAIRSNSAGLWEIKMAENALLGDAELKEVTTFPKWILDKSQSFHRPDYQEHTMTRK